MDAVRRNPEAREPYHELAKKLRAAGDPRGELIEIQLELEDAHGEAATELLEREAEHLEAHAAALLGPLAEVSTKRRTDFVFRRGFIDQFFVPLES